MNHPDTQPYFTFVYVDDEFSTKVVAADGYGHTFNPYETLLAGTERADDIHVAFNHRDSKLFVAVRQLVSDGQGGADYGDTCLSVAMTAEDLRNLADKLLAISRKLDAIGEGV